MAIIKLTTCDNVIEAHSIKNILENENIECFLTNEIITTLIPAYNGLLGAGIQIMIDEVDIEIALELISEPVKEKPVSCPNCKSLNISYGFAKRSGLKILGVVILLLITLPFGFIKKKYYCKDCKSEF
jgi:hypothetical protein